MKTPKRAAVIYGYANCDCVAKWVPVFERHLRSKGLIKSNLQGVITQGGYNPGKVKASAGTHDGGGVLDLSCHLWIQREIEQVVHIAIKLGAPCTFHRLPSEGDWGEHIHLALWGCKHRSPELTAQVKAAIAGFNGLGAGYRAKLSDNPRAPLITWKKACKPPKRVRVIKDRPTSYVRNGPGAGWKKLKKNGKARPLKVGQEFVVTATLKDKNGDPWGLTEDREWVRRGGKWTKGIK